MYVGVVLYWRECEKDVPVKFNGQNVFCFEDKNNGNFGRFENLCIHYTRSGFLLVSKLLLHCSTTPFWKEPSSEQQQRQQKK